LFNLKIGFLMNINSYVLFAMLSFFVLPAFANLSQTQETIQNKQFKSIACDDSGTHCFGLSHNPKKKYSLMLYRTDSAGESWYRVNTEFYRRIGSDEKLDASAGMGIACDQYLQNCLMGVTILHGQAFVFFGTHDGGQTWKGTIVWQNPTKTSQPSYIVQLTCNSSTGSQCHVLMDTNDIYILGNEISDSETTGTDALNLTIHPMCSH
jgi:hypothetical protein